MKKTRWMIITGIVLLVVAFACIFGIFLSIGKIVGSNPDELEAAGIVGQSFLILLSELGFALGLTSGLFFVIFGSIYGKSLDRKAKRKAEEVPNIKFSDTPVENKQEMLTLKEVEIINTNQLKMNDIVINMEDISKLHMEREEIRFKVNETEYVISYQNSSEALVLVGRIKQYSK